MLLRSKAFFVIGFLKTGVLLSNLIACLTGFTEELLFLFADKEQLVCIYISMMTWVYEIYLMAHLLLFQ